MKLINVNWYSIFYWLSIADNARDFFITFITIFTVISVLATICFIVGRDECMECPKDGLGERSKKWMWWAYPFMILFWAMYILTPSKTDTMLIIAGGSVGNFITSDSSSKQIPSDITKFLHLRLEKYVSDLSNSDREVIGIAPKTNKENFLDKAKDLSKEELIDYLKKDTTLK